MRTASIAATFDAAVDPTNITATTVALSGPEGNLLAGTPLVNGTILGYTPSLTLPGNTTYRYTLPSSIADTKGRTLGTPYTISFTTAAQSWAPTSTMLGSLPWLNGGTQPQSAVDSAGNVMVVWLVAGSNYSGIDTLNAARFDAATATWSAPVAIYAAPSSSSVEAPQLAAAADGFMLLWIDEGSLPVLSWTPTVMRFDTATSGWSAPEPITLGPPGQTVRALGLAPDRAGNLNVLGSVDTAGGTALFATRFEAAAASWSAPTQIDTPSTTNSASNVAAVADAAGNVTAAWMETVPNDKLLETARYDTSAKTWSAPRVVESGLLPTSGYDTPRLAADSLGSVTMTWEYSYGVGGTTVIHAAWYDATNGHWDAPAQIDGGDGMSGGAYSPLVVADPAGWATVTWLQSPGIYASRFDPATHAWSAPGAITPVSMNGAAGTSLTADIAGNVTAVFLQSNRITAIQYLAREARWQTPVLIDTPLTGSPVFANAPAATIDASGNITAAWFGQTSPPGTPQQYQVEANRFK